MTIRTLSFITIYLSFFLMWCQGFIEKAQERTEMFTQKQISQIFGNISEIYDVAQQFLKQLETAVSDSESAVHNALIGKCFLDHVSCTWSEQLLKFFYPFPWCLKLSSPCNLLLRGWWPTWHGPTFSPKYQLPSKHVNHARKQLKSIYLDGAKHWISILTGWCL